MTNAVRRSFRLACRSEHHPQVEALLTAQGYAFEPEPFAGFARMLTQEPAPLGASVAARFGRIYIQDRSSMLPPLALNPRPGAHVLDMCAAPGSKTGLLARMVGAQGFVLGCEPSAGRIASLRANLRRAGAVQTATLHASGTELSFGGDGFSYILLDPPCSGWGTEDKNPRAKALWSGDKVEPLIRLQRRLLEQGAALLRPGGRLVYSTCTTNEHENEAQVLFALEHLGLELETLPLPPGFLFEAPRLGCPDGVWRVAEDSEGEGFFVAALKRPGMPEDADSENSAAATHGHVVAMEGARRIRRDRLDCPELLTWDRLPDGELAEFAGKAVMLPAGAMQWMRPGMRWQGAALGRLRKGALRPDPLCRILMPRDYAPAMACDGALNVEDPEDIMALMSGRALTAPAGKGMVPLYFRGMPLGWAARKGSRVLWTEL